MLFLFGMNVRSTAYGKATGRDSQFDLEQAAARILSRLQESDVFTSDWVVYNISNFRHSILLSKAVLRCVFRYQQCLDVRPTVGVTRKWVGQDNAVLTESTSSQEKCLKTRRVPPVGCTLCWVAFLLRSFFFKLP